MENPKALRDFIHDPAFLNECLMGPNCLSLLDEMLTHVRIDDGMRVLDLGCGRGLTSMRVAERCKATVFATDLWISPTENYERFKAFGLDELIVPIHAEAHVLPYAENFFDAVVSVDSYHYYGAEEGYLENALLPLLKPGGLLAVVVPGLQKEFRGGIPLELRPYWQEDMHFHSCAWWRELWQRTGVLCELQCAEMEGHAAAWRDWLACDNEHAVRDVGMMRAEAGRYFCSVMLTARKAP